MAELNHLEILNQGVDVWNTWRRQNPSVHPNLHSAELGMMYSDSRLATYYRTEMPGVNLARAILIRADLYGADLRGADFSGADLRKTNFLAAELNGADFSHAHLFETQFLDCDLSGAKGLETCLHEGPSMIDHSTLGRSG